LPNYLIKILKIKRIPSPTIFMESIWLTITTGWKIGNPFQVFKMVGYLKDKTKVVNPIILTYSKFGDHFGPFDGKEQERN
jgi:hypothetical protein